MIYKPDTCKCVIILKENEIDPVTQRNVLKTENLTKEETEAQFVCPAHDGVDDVLDVVLTENETKNRAIGKLLETHSDIPQEAISFEVDEERNIKIKLSEEHKSKEAVDFSEFNGKVSVE